MNRYIKHANEQKKQSQNRNLPDRNTNEPFTQIQQDIKPKMNVNAITKT